eukprot:COSAG01_NODE_51786_length_352_cov_0.588933_1_plen_43_part_01
MSPRSGGGSKVARCHRQLHFFNEPATNQFYTTRNPLSLHDPLP